ncbi:kelch motif family protein, putative [Ichthyophthirius multifiliis]|uniref:Kelch motif family protein, putative n=1 Tax=Ichthyophthirius multifiliis TaxID=5932 RepID=G0QQX2_ICHMU|nr:kelch motif family protein, putative [Ichthyophthirius multifiliis]EGR32384.1 kelch motif family protein, putative [Ichthyophthirius multifiliis]|eukprot:XP_004035870.1 kelch motif family protein, putative [Ichthyophthirius multifiliis]
MADSDNEIIQFDNGDVFLRRYDPITKQTQMININKIKEIDFKESKITVDPKNDEKRPQKYTVPIYEPFQWYPVISDGDIPEQRGGHSLNAIGQFLILFGGCYLDLKCMNDIYFYNIVDQKWDLPKIFGDPPSPRGGHSSTLVGQYLYIFGGSSSLGIFSDLYRLDLTNRIWEELNLIGQKPSGRCNHKAILDNNGRIVIFGGYTQQGYSNEVFFLDLVNLRWEKPFINGELPRPRENFSMNLIRDSYIWIFGGYSIGGENNDIWQLDVENMKWRIISQSFGTKPIERQGHQTVLHGKYIYIIGGCNYKQEKCFNEVYQLNIEDITWTNLEFPLQNILEQMDNSSISLMGADLYVFGGCKMMRKCYNDFLVMNISDVCPKKCHNKGICRNNRCQCEEGYFGESCEIQLLCERNCSNRGICGSDGRCKCFPGFSGKVCEIYVPCPFNCTDQKQGKCLDNGSCQCLNGYYGDSCEIFERISCFQRMPQQLQWERKMQQGYWNLYL